MELALGLPNTVAGTGGDALLCWAVEGENAGFSSLACLDRIVYDSYDCLTTLAAAAAVTERIGLATTVLIGPLRRNTALLAKQAATVDRISGGRLTLGMAVGVRPDDFRASEAAQAGRGGRFEEQITELRRIWAQERRGFAGGVGPVPERPKGPPLILGGHSRAAITRAATLGDGWISGSGGVGMFRHGAAEVRSAWRKAGRPGEPRLLALAYVSLGEQAPLRAAEYVGGYYGFAPPYARAVLEATAIGAEAVADTVHAFADAGCDELVLAPCSADVEQVKLLREAVP
jgi:alkanesulfonate monooxygenase SsuD/methylene tetrahydromethanopterin reductase-like flavin-dependent oxidoreductase (luciferase family)